MMIVNLTATGIIWANGSTCSASIVAQIVAKTDKQRNAPSLLP